MRKNYKPIGYDIHLGDCTNRHQYLFQMYYSIEGGSGSLKQMGSTILPQYKMLTIKTSFRDAADVGGCP